MTEGKFVYVGVRDKEHAEEYAFDVSNPENPNPQDFHEIPAGPRIRSSHELESSSMRFENAVFRAGRGLQRDTLRAFFYRTGKSITIPTPGAAGDVFSKVSVPVLKCLNIFVKIQICLENGLQNSLTHFIM